MDEEDFQTFKAIGGVLDGLDVNIPVHAIPEILAAGGVVLDGPLGTTDYDIDYLEGVLREHA